MKKRILSILLVCCMVLTLLPTTAFAAEGETGARASNPGGLCEHHPEHDEACGYTEGTAEIPCSHEHTEECYSLITRCVHAHTAECYPAESVSENADGLSEAENAAPTECVHGCTEKSGCILQASDCKHAHGKDCGYAPASIGKSCTYVCEICGSKDGKTPMPLLGAARPAATQYTYTLHYDANGGSGAPPSQSETSSELSVWIPISEKIPTRDGYTFKGWADSPNENPKYLREEGYYWNYLMVHPSLNETIYAIWEVHNHSWGEWTSNGNGTHTRTCTTDSSHTETGNCSGGKATSTEKAICETCHTAYGELLQLTKTVITTPPTLPSEGYVSEWYFDEDLKGGEAMVEGTDIVVPGSFRFKHNWGGNVYPGENRMEILFTPDDAETYATAECIVIVTGIKHTITSVTEEVLTDEPLGTAFEDLLLPPFVEVKTNTGRTFGPIPVTWDGSTYDPSARGEQIITGELHVEESFHAEELEPTSIKAIARITLIGDEPIVPTLEQPTYSRQIYSGDFCQLAFSDEYLSGGKATADGETVPGVFTLNEEQELYGYWRRDGGLVQVGPLALKVTFTPDDLQKYTTAECTVNVDVIPRKFRHSSTTYIDNKKIGTAFEDLGLPNAFYFFAATDEPNHEGSGLNGNVPGIIKWDDSNYDPNSYEEQTIYGEVNRAEFEKYYIVPEGADLRGVIKVTLQADPAETEITQPPVFRWKNGDFTLPDNTMFVNRIFEMGATGGGSANLADGVARVKGTDTVVPGTFSFKEGTPGWFDELGENVVTVVFTPTDQHGYRTAETTIKVNVIKNTFKRCEEPDPITEKKLGTTFAGLNLPEIVVVEAIDGLRVGMEVSWEESSYDAQSTAWQTIPGTLVFDANDEHRYQQPEPAVTAAIRVKLLGSEDAPAITTTTLPGGTVGTPYHHQLQATGGGFILWELFSGELPKGLTLKQTTGEISGTPTAEGTAQFTVRALNSVGNDKKELSITITNAPAAEHTITVTTAGGGTASASSTSATAGTEITLTATPNTGYHFKEWQVESLAGLVITNNKFTMPDSNVTIKAIFEEDSPFAPTKHTVTVKTDGNGIAFASPLLAVAGTEITLTAMPKEGYHFKEWQAISGGVAIENNKFLMPDSNVEVKAVFEKDAPPAPTDPGKPSISVTGAYTYNGSEHTATVSGYNPATMDIAGNTATDAGDYTVRVTSKTGRWADGSTGAVTAAWSIGKATQEAPNGLIGVAPTTEGGSDGKITGVDATMEYRAESETIYTACTGIEIENLPAGNYFVRYAEDHNHFASPDAEVTVGEGTPLADCTITFNAGGGSGSMDSVTVNAGTIYILPACGFTAPADQEFKAWEIGGTEYKVGDSYTVLVDTEIKALWENSVITPTTYTVTVSNDGNGTASASHAKAAAGTEITLTATPQIGYHFKEWQVESPAGLVITTNKFTMPDGNVDVKAIFEKDAPPAPTEFIVTFDGNGGTPSVGSMTTTDRKLTSLPSASRSGSYSFYGWYTEKSGGTKITTDTVFHANATVYAHWTYTGGGGGGYNPPVTYYTLRFETGGGSDIPSVQGTYNTYIDLTKYVPAWRGHAFIGWYSERSLTNKVSGVYLTKDMTVYAGWRVDENPGTGVNPFTDISEKDWFYGDVMFVYENGLMLGTSKTLFSPHGTAMRGMMATILWRMEGSPVPKGKNSFTDVEAGKWYADAITWTAENGIFAGYGKDKFGPGDPITREQLAAIFYRYADYKGYDLTVKGDLDKFKDADKITDYAKTAMQWAVGSGLVNGKSGNLLDPQGTATRAEIAAMLHRFIEKYELVQGKAPGGLMGWIDPKWLQTGDSSV
ncbi:MULTISPECIES: InlB B-repeat-containing protein [Blautia]|uniref:InlB B-repeat-containing protein n=1 Tax=Blautia TaxID=572511 RepID=UPI0018AC41E8|nr:MULTISPECIES: InlB B-repeat-containing protein [Blautia]MDB6459587.1 InlB B-repeat-containing protein [Blautia wexlerae]MDB6462808.1 InlB B-repeat-containing protein [Blautia wexlerae]MDB6466162.1 InlB B-repeat-containing protein [Blautia wexlerae]